MLAAGNSVGKIIASGYAHNQLYYNQLPNRKSAWARSFLNSEPVHQYYRAAVSGIALVLKAVKDMKSSSQNLLQADKSAFVSRMTETSDKTSFTASASKGASLKTYRVRADQVAAAQVNSGSFLAKSSQTSIQSGMNQLKITVGGKSTTVSAFIYGGETNEQALTKLKDSINEAHTGVTAGLVTDSKTGDKKLELTGETGTKNAFSVTAVTGNAAAATGIGNVKSAAADAVYSIDGGPSVTSSSNEIELEKGKASATLLNPTSEDVEIRVKPDKAGVLQQVKQLAADYNSTLKRVSDAGGYLSLSARRSLESAAGGQENMGITKKADGTLEFDETKFEQSLSTRFEQTRDVVSGSFGLAAKLSKAADRFENVPPSAMLNSRMRDLQSFAAYQPATGFYLQMPIKGLLFDGTF